MISFDDFCKINEELNYRITNDTIEFIDRWFYYDYDDEIVYGCDEIPTSEKCMFAFNPGSCEVIYDKEKFEYDINNPICIITLKLDKSNEFSVYTEKAYDFLKSEIKYNSSGGDIRNDRTLLQELIEKKYDYRILIIYGKELVASTFDIIEEN